MERFCACWIAFSPYVHARDSIYVSQHLQEDRRRGRSWTTRLRARNGEVFEVGESSYGDKCFFSSRECYHYCGRPLVSLRSQNICRMR